MSNEHDPATCPACPPPSLELSPSFCDLVSVYEQGTQRVAIVKMTFRGKGHPTVSELRTVLIHIPLDVLRMADAMFERRWKQLAEVGE